MSVDISSEAVERLAKTADLFAKAMKAWQHKTQKHNEDVRDTLRAQAERIAELEAENAILRTEKHADAEAIAAMREAGMDRLVAEGQKCDAIAKARNDALRQAKAQVWDGTYHISPEAAQKAVDIFCALIEGATND